MEQLSQSPGLAWIDQLRNDPRVDWKAVEARFEEWDYEAQGLTEVGAALVALVTTFVTAGMASHLSAVLSGALGFSGNAAMQTAIQAGIQSLINRTAISLVNNQGDLGKVLKELGSSDTLRSLATAMITAGLTTHLSTITGLGTTLPVTAPLQDRIVQDLQHGLLRATVRAGVGTAIQGGKLEKNLLDAMRWEASSTLGKYAAEQIGQAAREGKIDKVTQLIAHAALGCAAGAIAAGECGSGAVGAVVGEMVGWHTVAKIERDIKEALQKDELTRAEAEELVTQWRADGVSMARLVSGLSAALAGGNVDVGAGAGENAANNNAIPAVIFIIAIALEALDKALLAKDAYDISIALHHCNGGNQASCDQAAEMAQDAAIGAGIELTVGAVIPGSKAATDLARWVRKNADADTVRQIENISNKLPAGLPDNLTGYADPKHIRFTQDSVSSNFKDGGSLQEMINGLKSGKLSPDDIPPIRVFERDGLVYSLDNRRLLAASEAGVPIKIVPATPAEIAKESWKMTTPNSDTIICIRGSCK